MARVKQGKGTKTLAKQHVVPVVDEKTTRKNPEDKKKRRKKRKEINFRSSIKKLMKNVYPDHSISSKSMSILDNVAFVLLKKFSEEAGAICRSSKRKTISASDVEASAFSLIPDEMAVHAYNHGAQALIKYQASFSSSE